MIMHNSQAVAHISIHDLLWENTIIYLFIYQVPTAYEVEKIYINKQVMKW